MTRGNSEYAVELCSDILVDAPGCIDARRLLRKAQRQVFAARGQRLGARIANSLVYSILPLGYLSLSSNPGKSMAIGERALCRDAYSARALSLIARGANKLGYSKTEAFCLESICDRYPDNAVKLERLCQALIKVGSTEKALTIAERLTRLRPGSGHVQELVKSASVAHSINKGKWEENEEDFRSKLKNKEESDSLERANRMAMDERGSEERIRDLTNAIHQDPQLIDNYKLLIRTFLSLERYDEALSWLDKAFTLPQAEGDVSMIQLRSELIVNRVEREVFDLKRSVGEADEPNGRLAKLERELLDLKLEESRKLVEQFPNDYARRFKYGEFLLEAGSTDQATQQFQLAQRSPSLRLKSLVLLGRCFMAKNLYDLAFEQLKNASENLNTMDDFKKEVLYLLAECLERLERKGEAIDVFKSIYSSDIGYRDVASKIDAFYAKRDVS